MKAHPGGRTLRTSRPESTCPGRRTHGERPVKVRCPRCDALYSLAEDRAQPGARIRCRRCEEIVTISTRERRDPTVGAVSASKDSSDRSALFSLAALTASASADTERTGRPPPSSEDSDSGLIDLGRLRSEAAPTGADVPAVGAWPGPPQPPELSLGLAPLGSPPNCDPFPLATAHGTAEAIRRTNRAGLVIGVASVTLALAIATALVYVRTAGQQPSAASTVVPAAEAASTVVAPAMRTVEPAAPEPPASSTTAESQAPAEVPARTGRAPVPRRGQQARPPASPKPGTAPPVRPSVRADPPPRPRPASRDKCAHCGATDLRCHMACNAQ